MRSLRTGRTATTDPAITRLHIIIRPRTATDHIIIGLEFTDRIIAATTEVIIVLIAGTTERITGRVVTATIGVGSQASTLLIE